MKKNKRLHGAQPQDLSCVHRGLGDAPQQANGRFPRKRKSPFKPFLYRKALLAQLSLYLFS